MGKRKIYPLWVLTTSWRAGSKHATNVSRPRWIPECWVFIHGDVATAQSLGNTVSHKFHSLLSWVPVVNHSQVFVELRLLVKTVSRKWRRWRLTFWREIVNGSKLYAGNKDIFFSFFLGWERMCESLERMRHIFKSFFFPLPDRTSWCLVTMLFSVVRSVEHWCSGCLLGKSLSEIYIV